MAAPALLVSLVLVLASTSAWVFSGVSLSGNGRLKHLHMYMHEITGEANATTAMAVTNTKFSVALLDNELRDGPDRNNSKLIGRFQGVVVYLGMVTTPPGKETVISLVFTDGENAGSTLAVMGSLITVNGAYERPIVGGTGKFRMARGYSNTTILSLTSTYNRYELNLFVKIDS